ncbi:hypothetical protein LTR53_017485 [Teratosphaeriaceae sp. CCFEE 6253]|nr:hypothetical protein LTR53_017485 [Teratosphaeriaceae sp. CCFEE 6253]
MAANPGVPISPVGVSKPELTLSAASINDEPVELDGVALESKPTSPEHPRRGSRADVVEDVSPEEREKRAQLISDRQDDPAVLVDIPQTPDADEFEQASTIEADEGAIRKA